MTSRTDRWIQERAAHWQSLEAALPAMEDQKEIGYDTLRQVIHVYPEMARDVALLRRDAPGSRTTTYLEQLFQRCHRVLFSPPRTGAVDFLAMLRNDIPQITYQLRWQVFSVALLFLLGIAVGALLVSTYPEMATLFASESMIEGVQRGELWTDGLLNIIPSSLLSVQILTNNILVALTAMSLGALYGLGTLYIIGLNGLMLGGVFAMTAQYSMAGDLFDFVAAHGFVELSVIVVAGAIGFSLGEALARPGELSRSHAFQAAARRGTKLMALCVIFLFGAGFIEGYISPNDVYSRPVRVAVGIAYWCVFAFALCGWRIPRRTTPDASP